MVRLPIATNFQITFSDVAQTVSNVSGDDRKTAAAIFAEDIGNYKKTVPTNINIVVDIFINFASLDKP